ncbi:alpha-ribazole phosphatase [Halarsenatibacter silvermanii]|uniref:Alpha-ribazole phosphatase n=1 Tax=Halarsenatibacter silvermanii TaxID=321763 RepID=A0A1G9I135_9FIRM|nr:alpha-ribazole phosphatase [Halarsenatibacter silvermanii]SDL18947.1 phosphoglycerate mutase [Halarsenatibacter silvermanii]
MSEKKELILIRHGETEWNKNKRYQGQEDVALNDTGRQQARRAAEFIAEENIDKVCSSDLSRARDTAAAIARSRQLEVKEYPGLREIDFGRWEGKNYETIREEYGDRFDNWLDDPGEVSPPGGEDMYEFMDRVSSALTEILSGNGEEKIAVVAHGGALRIYLIHLLGIPLERYTRLYFNNGSISRIDFYEGKPVVRLVNGTFHLNGV